MSGRGGTVESLAAGQQLALDPRSAPVQYRLAAVWQSKGKLARAVAGYEDAIRARPDYVPAHLELAGLLAREGRVDEAARVYRRAIEMNPREACFRQQLETLLADHGPSDHGPSAEVDTPSPTAFGAAAGDAQHVMLYTDCSGTQGAERWNHLLLCGLADAGHRVSCAQGRASHFLVQERQARGIPHFWIEADDLYSRAASAPSLTDESDARRVFASARPDLVLFSDGCPLSNLAAKQAARQLGIPYLVVVHCVTAAWAPRFALHLPSLRQTFEQALAVVCVSGENLRVLRESFGLPPRRGDVIHPAVARRFFSPSRPPVRAQMRRELGIPARAVVSCTVAAMEMRKGYQYQLQALRVLRASEAWASLHFLWIGSGTLEPQLRAVAAQLGVADRLHVLGERSDVEDVLDASDLFVLTSEFEGMPTSIMEAMARGLPVAATAVSGIPEELGDTGALLPDPRLDPHATAQELARTIRLWASDQSLRRSIGAAGRRRARARFTEERLLRDFRALIGQPNGSLYTRSR